MSEINYTLPVIPLREVTVLPDMILHFDVSRAWSVRALETAMMQEQTVFLITQKDPAVEAPGPEDLYDCGTVARVKQLVRLPKDVIRVLVEGKFRASLDMLVQKDGYLEADVTVVTDEPPEGTDMALSMLRYMKNLLEVYGSMNTQFSQEMVRKLLQEEDAVKLLNQLCVNIPMEYTDRQTLLDALEVQERFERLMVLMTREIDVIRINREIASRVRERVDKNQREYVLREQMRVIREELGESNTLTEAEEFEEALRALKANKSVKEKIAKEIDRYKSMGSNQNEGGMLRSYIETLLEMPWDKVSKDNNDIRKAEKILREDHYGLEKVKERILEYLAVRQLAKKGDAPILCLVGPPGTGKTSIGRSVARALNKKYIRISLGGVHDEAEIRGHRKTYIGAMPGRIAVGLKQAGVSNPVLLLDEVDKIGSDYKGDPFAAMLEVLDSEQNCRFRDNYIEIPVDLSEVLFIATANTTASIPRPLLDRMEIIEISGYTENEKMHIAREHLIPKQADRHGFMADQIVISDKALEQIILNYTREAGVRNLERRIGDICRKSAHQILKEMQKPDRDKKAARRAWKASGTSRVSKTSAAGGVQDKVIRITERNLEKFLGKPRYTYEQANETDQVGIVRGLAWTEVGGDTLSVEVNLLPGKGRFELTGQLGDVMKESAKAGISYIRSISSRYGIDPEFFENHDIHIHIPEGAVPKDGPSAGITMATAMLSAIVSIPVRWDVAMTGEITLRGRVLPIGGLKEKLLAARVAHMKRVIVPDENRRDVRELDREITDGLEILYAKTMEDVLGWALATAAQAAGDAAPDDMAAGDVPAAEV